ncbi:MAG: TIM-barrel domain-containing protein [Bacteroidales bacterium]
MIMVNNRSIKCISLFALFVFLGAGIYSQSLHYDSIPVRVEISEAGNTGIRLAVIPAGFDKGNIENPSLTGQADSEPLAVITSENAGGRTITDNFIIEYKPDPLEISVKTLGGETVQELLLMDNGHVLFNLDDDPVLGMGEGGPRMGRGWRNEDIEFDRRGRYHAMQPRWQANAYGSRNPVPMLVGTGGWALFVASPWVQVDMTDDKKGIFIPRNTLDVETRVQDHGDQQQNAGKGVPPADSYVPGLFDVFVFDLSEPREFMNDLAEITGRAVMPPKWALGYMQSHRTLEDDKQMINIVETFREKKIPVDAVIYLGTGFCPRGWNTEQPSFDFNPEVFSREPSKVIDDLHDLNVKVAVHIVPWDRDKLPTLHGNIPPEPGEKTDNSHILNYWKQHIGLVESGVDAWWPDEGDWFNLHERIKRHQLYYQGPLYSEPNVRPWSLHRNGYLGVARWGGWVWSGDTESAWKTLEGQVAVGINHSLSLSPFWGSDIGGFYPNEELDGELYARWFQFGAFCPSFRSHGRTWWTRLPWGWGLDSLGPVENRDNPLVSELNNPAIEVVCRNYAELRYRLLSYNYTLAWQARDKGIPMMRAMWLHYPGDKQAAALGNQYLWGEDMLVAPVYEKGATERRLYLPEGLWYDWWNNDKHEGGRYITRSVNLDIMPLFVKAGSIIPFDPQRQYTSQTVDESLEIRVYKGADGSFTLYEDDGISLDYLENKGFSLTEFRWDDSARTLTVSPQKTMAASSGDTRELRIMIMPSGETETVVYKGAELEIAF